MRLLPFRDGDWLFSVNVYKLSCRFGGRNDSRRRSWNRHFADDGHLGSYRCFSCNWTLDGKGHFDNRCFGNNGDNGLGAGRHFDGDRRLGNSWHNFRRWPIYGNRPVYGNRRFNGNGLFSANGRSGNGWLFNDSRSFNDNGLFHVNANNLRCRLSGRRNDRRRRWNLNFVDDGDINSDRCLNNNGPSDSDGSLDNGRLYSNPLILL